LINSGEGGLITTNDARVAGRIILMSGSYGFYKAGHKLLPPDDLMAELHDLTPNFSMRMTDLTAALIRP
jgi:dTDP-4-amino-4,6-dideoxygalactose transaminase